MLDVDAKKREIHMHDAGGCTTLRSGDRLTSSTFPWLTFDVREVFSELDD